MGIADVCNEDVPNVMLEKLVQVKMVCVQHANWVNIATLLWMLPTVPFVLQVGRLFLVVLNVYAAKVANVVILLVTHLLYWVNSRTDILRTDILYASYPNLYQSF